MTSNPVRAAFLIVAIVFFLLGAFEINLKDPEGHPRFNVVSAGLAFLTAAFLF